MWDQHSRLSEQQRQSARGRRGRAFEASVTAAEWAGRGHIAQDLLGWGKDSGYDLGRGGKPWGVLQQKRDLTRLFFFFPGLTPAAVFRIDHSRREWRQGIG